MTATDNAAYFHQLAKRARKHPAAVLPAGSRELALHEGGHVAAALALGGRVDRLGERYCTATIHVGTRPDDVAWASAVFLWAGALAAGTLAGAYDDLAAIKALGRCYLVDRDDCSAFAGARLIIGRHKATIDAIAEHFVINGAVDEDTLTELTAGIR